MEEMSIKQTARVRKFVESVNQDIGRELRTASAFICQAQNLEEPSLRFVGAQYLRIGAASMWNATALSAEVLAMGGNPPAGPADRKRTVARWTTRQQIKDTARTIRHYLCRWRAAQRLDLLRLAEVFREIIQSRRNQLERIMALASEGGTACPSPFRWRGARLAGLHKRKG
jgi:hypothetical protein